MGLRPGCCACWGLQLPPPGPGTPCGAMPCPSHPSHLTCLQLHFGNLVYLYLGVGFIQMLKLSWRPRFFCSLRLLLQHTCGAPSIAAACAQQVPRLPTPGPCSSLLYRLPLPAGLHPHHHNGRPVCGAAGDAQPPPRAVCVLHCAGHRAGVGWRGVCPAVALAPLAPLASWLASLASSCSPDRAQTRRAAARCCPLGHQAAVPCEATPIRPPCPCPSYYCAARSTSAWRACSSCSSANCLRACAW